MAVLKLKLTQPMISVIQRCCIKGEPLRSYVNKRGRVCFEGIQDVGSTLFLTISGRAMLDYGNVLEVDIVKDGITYYNFTQEAMDICGVKNFKSL
ncbi:cell envelope biogenesis protein [Vibrio phage VAP7]|uniref:Cell envelope biogenesis protein n=1 Tax=Vibrio phage VAP7 TaxID=2584487 RepID=A0A4Y5TV39_9CAUD|nr:cell envelope biogenesis protein [Vibrio phage VAP7]QDB73230.1 cell envelope biogenesis protein [Vibrio phage VAP7]UFD98085.1 hypothetical protein [Vibrio phage BX-1]